LQKQVKTISTKELVNDGKKRTYPLKHSSLGGGDAENKNPNYSSLTNFDKRLT